MAMSNYDLLAFDNKGNPCNGILKSGNTIAKIYKNWLYIENTKMWNKDESSFSRPTIAQINGGGFCNIGKMEIHTAWDTHQNSILVFCQYNHYGKKRHTKKRMVGIGCSGFLDTTSIYIEKMGLDPTKYWFGGSSHHDGISKEIVSCFMNDKIEEHIVPKEFVISFEDSWIGVDQQTYKSFLKFLEDLVENYTLDKEYFEIINKQTPLRANQGDLYFADHLGLKHEGTPIEESETPMIGNIIKKIAESKPKEEEHKEFEQEFAEDII
jgi:hypothetical protein